ncbi:MAG: phosphoglycerate mutase [Microgenomates group bacterium GW2011_GWC1_44_37]|nr:MAG: phosphoglycerate mutase [Microgenomates group bacterium GW2011_GWC1_44_37]
MDSTASYRRHRLEAELSSHGRYQAYHQARKLNDLGVNVLLSSPLARAENTAKVISKDIKLPFIVVNDLREIDLPEDVYGAKRNGPENLRYKKAWIDALSAHDGSWKLDDQGESTVELLVREDKVIQMILERYRGKKVAIVSHGVFLAFFMSRLFLGKQASISAVFDLARSHYLRHGGIAHIRGHEGAWQLIHFDRS